EMVSRGTFREDLFYRINLITVRLPALRERPADIPRLVSFFVDNLKTLYNRPNLQVSKDAQHWLKGLSLPGNIRQLKNVVERAVLLAPSDTLTIPDFEKHLPVTSAQPISSSSQYVGPPVGSMTLDQMERQMIERAMAFHQNRVANVARALGITRFALYRRLEKYGIAFQEE
ncbi:MAG TPA: helix-turn-helix domain-containing protein, partial [Hymenobacter sp.]|nr:helix-turn-helix domain-containing protein [Hymenobacter sp.]